MGVRGQHPFSKVVIQYDDDESTKTVSRYEVYVPVCEGTVTAAGILSAKVFCLSADASAIKVTVDKGPFGHENSPYCVRDLRKELDNWSHIKEFQDKSLSKEDKKFRDGIVPVFRREFNVEFPVDQEDLGFTVDEDGIVTAVDEGSEAAQRDVRVGDVLARITLVEEDTKKQVTFKGPGNVWVWRWGHGGYFLVNVSEADVAKLDA